MSIDNTTEIPLPDPLADSPQPPIIRYWRTLADAPFTETVFINAEISPLSANTDLTHTTVILPTGGEAEARDWLGSGAQRILFTDAAVRDTTLVSRMAAELGEGKVGVWLPVKRMGVSWVLDKTSNADFSIMAPSIGKPGWEVLLTNGARTGIDADWWSQQMLQQGASCILISADYTNEQDHNIAAELAEKCGNALWLSPLYQTGVEWKVEDWQQYANAGQIVITPPAKEAEGEIA